MRKATRHNAQINGKSAKKLGEHLFRKGNTIGFSPGESGNPGGRPKRDIAAEIAAAAFEMDREGILKAVRAGLKSKKLNPRLYQVLAERGFGKLPQPVTGADGGPVKMEFVIRDLSK